MRPRTDEAFYRHLLLDTFADDLPEKYWPEGGSRWMDVVRTIIQAPESFWWDDKATPDRTESRDEILLRSFSEGVAELEKKLGGDSGAWTWGRIHTSLQPLVAFDYSSYRSCGSALASLCRLDHGASPDRDPDCWRVVVRGPALSMELPSDGFSMVPPISPGVTADCPTARLLRTAMAAVIGLPSIWYCSRHSSSGSHTNRRQLARP